MLKLLMFFHCTFLLVYGQFQIYSLKKNKLISWNIAISYWSIY